MMIDSGFDITSMIDDYSALSMPGPDRIDINGPTATDLLQETSYTEYLSPDGILHYPDPFRLGYNINASYWGLPAEEEIGPMTKQEALRMEAESGGALALVSSVNILLVVGLVGIYYLTR